MERKVAYSIDDLVKIGVGSRSHIYEEIRSGRLIARKQAARTIVLATDLDTYLQALPAMEVKVGGQAA